MTARKKATRKKSAKKKASRKKSASNKAKMLSFLEGKVAISTRGELDVSETENRVVHVPELDDFFIVQGGGGTAWWSVELDHSATLEEVVSPHWDPKPSDGAGEVGSRNVAHLPGVEVHEWIEGEAYNTGDVIWDESGYEDPKKLKGKVKYLATALGEEPADVLAWEFPELEDRVLDWVRELVDTEEAPRTGSASRSQTRFFLPVSDMRRASRSDPNLIRSPGY